MDISNIDKNFKVETKINKEDMANITIKTLELAGFAAAVQALRL